MTVLSIKKFNGEVPRLPSHTLPVGAASYAKNCDFAHGELRPLKGLGTPFTAAAGAQPVRALFTDDGQRFFCWNKPTRAFLAPTIDDTFGRVYYLKHGDPLRVALTSGMALSGSTPGEPATYWKVGVTAPAAPVPVLGTATGGEIESVTVVAVATNIWGEESAPSTPVTFDKELGQSVTFTVTHAPTAGEQVLSGISFYRTYGATADYFLINAAPVPLAGTAVLVDSSDTVQTTTTLQSAEWDLPPATMSNLTYVGNGFFACFSGKDVVFSEPYRPHAWPYRMTLPSAGVGILPVEGGILVTTAGPSFMISGAHPTQMSQTYLPIDQAGWSDTAMARVEGVSAYASNDGLVSVAGGQPSIRDSQALFTRKDWRAAFGAARQNLRLAHHDGYLLGLVDPTYPIGASAEPFLLRLDEAAGSYCRLDAGQPLYGAGISGPTDQLLVGTATGVAEFAGSATALSYTWQSGDIMHPNPTGYRAGFIDCTGSVTVEVYADTVLRRTVAVTGRTEFRLPDGPDAYRWSVKLIGTATVREISLGATFMELKGV